MVKVVNNSMETEEKELDRQMIMVSVDRQLIMASRVCAKTPWGFTSFVWQCF